MEKILCFTLPIFFLIFVFFKDSEHAWILSALTSSNIGSSIFYLWTCKPSKDEFKIFLNSEAEDMHLIKLDSNTILCRFKKREKDS